MHGDFPDGHLSEAWAQHGLAASIGRFARHFGATEIITFDDDGLDGHEDHIAVTRAAAMVARSLNVAHLGRTFGDGVLEITGDADLKLSALGEHHSQFDLATGAGDTFDRLAPYLNEGLEVERYALLSARVLA